MMKRIFTTLTFLSFTLLLLACPQQQQQAKRKMDYSDAEQRLRVAMNVNEMAYSSWNRLYESFGQLKRDGRLSEARWASLQAIDSVIVLTEADLIDGIDRSKKLLETWRKSSLNLLTAENPQDVLTLRERELEALNNFQESVGLLTMKSVKLRDSYSEAMVVADKAVKEGLPLPAEHLQAIRQVVRMVDMEIGRTRPPLRSAGVTEKKERSPVAVNVK
ncbi:MAG TPA: hypothetical protein VFZ34_28030 [Blastocatellia bacterium]|nr:hypothetical protein [Blastocatellia bacterium]